MAYTFRTIVNLFAFMSKIFEVRLPSCAGAGRIVEVAKRVAGQQITPPPLNQPDEGRARLGSSILDINANRFTIVLKV